jgi:general secretion pathway protein D
MNLILSHLIGRKCRFVYVHARYHNTVKPLVKSRRLLVWIAPMCLLAWAPPTAEDLFKSAQKAEHSGQTAQAYVLYAQAAAADPSNIRYWERAQALRPAASLPKVSLEKPIDEPPPVDPALFGRITEQDLDQARKPLPPPQLMAAPGRQDFDLRGDSKTLWEKVAEAFKLKIVFDGAYQPTRALRFQLDNADYRDALRILQIATDSFVSVISERMILVANDTTPKRNDFERTAAIVIPFSETMATQELQEIVTGIRGTLDMQRIVVDNQRHLIMIRDRITKVRLAQKILEDLMRPRPQVAIEVELLTTSNSSALSYGLSLPTSFPLVSFVTRPYLVNSIPSGISSFIGFGGGASLLGLGVASASLFGTISKSNAESVLRSEVVALDGQAATFHVGDKYPIVTNQYLGTTTGTGQVYTPPPTFNFEDLGLSLKITPHIHGVDEVSLDIDAEFKLLGAGSVDGIPIVSNRKYESKVRLVTGEWAVLAGLMTGSDARTITGIPILSAIPFLRSNKINKDSSQTLIVFKPHLQILPPTETATWRAWTGSETRLPTEF